MKEKPILFSTPMVQAILEGRKTQTRRLVKYQKAYDIFPNGKKEVEAVKTTENMLPCKYKIGDILWVRETFHKYYSESTGIIYSYKADNKLIEDAKIWKPSIFMPREAARIFLEVTNVRVERIQDISEEDAIAEGIESWIEERLKSKPVHYKMYSDFDNPNDPALYSSNPIDSYESLWRKINGKDSWKQNPFVWVYDFKRINEPNK